MEQQGLLSEAEEARLLDLMGQQPESAGALQELIDAVTSRTVEVVRRDPEVARRLEAARYRVLGMDLREEKTGDNSGRAEVRLAEVGIYDYDSDMLVVPIIDLRSGRVVGIEERVGRQPPLTPEEVEEAKRLVFSDPEYEHLQRHENLQVVAFPAQFRREDDPALGHRCFTLYFWTGGDQLQRVGTVKVDLSAGQIVPLDEEELRALEEQT